MTHAAYRARLKGRACYAGFDLSSTKDLTALVGVFPDADGFDVCPNSSCPAESIRERAHRDRVPYDEWARRGLLNTTPGNSVDYAYVRQTVLEWARLFDLKWIGVDPWNARGLITQLAEQDGLTVVEVRQGFASLSGPAKALETAILSRKLRHNGHDVLRWCVGNVALETDAAGNIKPRKAASTERIDGVVALVMAIDQMERHQHSHGARLCRAGGRMTQDADPPAKSKGGRPRVAGVRQYRLGVGAGERLRQDHQSGESAGRDDLGARAPLAEAQDSVVSSQTTAASRHSAQYGRALMLERAYSLLEIKSVAAERRTFTGIASTPELDREGDMVDPAGVRFRNPVPLLYHHDQTQPIGTAHLSVTADGILFEASLPTIDEPGPLKTRVDDAWQCIKAGVITGVSIGHLPTKGGDERLASGARTPP